MKHPHTLLLTALFAGALATGTHHAQAQAVPVAGNASIQVEGGVFSSAPSKADMQRAIDAARVSLWKNYAARSFSQARARQMVGREAEIEQRLGDFMSDVTIVDKSYDKSTNTFRVAVRGNVNTTLVDQYFNALAQGTSQLPASAQAPADGAPQGNTFAFLMLARQVASARQFEAKVTKVREDSGSRTRSDSTADATRGRQGGSAETSATEASESSLSKSTTGGSTERKSDQLVYQVQSSQDIDTAMGSTITTGGFEVVSYDDIVGNCGGAEPGKVRDEFVAADEMSVGVRKQVIDAVRRCEVRYFAVGTIDAGASEVDPVSGQRRVVVSVRAQVLDVSRRLPTRVASVGPVQFAALGPDQSVATRNALDRAARESTRTLMDQLNSKGIR